MAWVLMQAGTWATLPLGLQVVSMQLNVDLHEGSLSFSLVIIVSIITHKPPDHQRFVMWN